VKALRTTNGIVEQASEAELANAATLTDRFGFFSDPQTGVALATLIRLVKSGQIPRASRTVVISTAHGLKFIDFKMRFHQGSLAGTDSSLQNLPLSVPHDVDAVRAAIDGRLTA
jgi:threonine synthase